VDARHKAGHDEPCHEPCHKANFIGCILSHALRMRNTHKQKAQPEIPAGLVALFDRRSV